MPVLSLASIFLHFDCKVEEIEKNLDYTNQTKKYLLNIVGCRDIVQLGGLVPKSLSSNGLGFVNPMLLLRRWDWTSFCMHLGNREDR